MANIEAQLDDLRTRAATSRRNLRTILDETMALAPRMRRAVEEVGESWSGSWAGYHASLYYGEFERPPLDETFDGEWGGLHPMSPLWKSRSKEEVTAKIEQRADGVYSDLHDMARRAQEMARSVKNDALSVLVPILSVDGSDLSQRSVAALEGDIEAFSAQEYLRGLMPSQVISRDSMAATQGLKHPPHLVYLAQVESVAAAVSKALDYVESVERTCKQVANLRILRRKTPEAEQAGASERERTKGEGVSSAGWTLLVATVIVAIGSFWLIGPQLTNSLDTGSLSEKSPLGVTWGSLLANIVTGVIAAAIVALLALAYRYVRRVRPHR